MIELRTITTYYAAVRDKPVINTGETRLMVAMIKQAIKDLDDLIGDANYSKSWYSESTQLIRWFNTNKHKDMSLIYVCDLLGMNVDIVRSNSKQELDTLKKLIHR